MRAFAAVQHGSGYRALGRRDQAVLCIAQEKTMAALGKRAKRMDKS
jgi:hypothetical protein